jgi:predicted nucleic-acid-binding Zn-ribbon protein
MKICKECKVGQLKNHETLYWYIKCSICGYTEFDEESYNKRPENLKNSNKLSLKPELIMRPPRLK